MAGGCDRGKVDPVGTRYIEIAQFAVDSGRDLRKLRAWALAKRGESWQLSAHPDVSEVSRLGSLGGTTGRAGADARSRDEAGEAVASPESRRNAASALVETHDAVFRRTARRYSICADDSEDAYQRALEILLTKAPPIEGDALVRWMQTVTKREALAVRRQRERLLGAPRTSGFDDEVERDPLESIASESPGPNDRAASRERVARSGEALQALKPQEARALTLKAQGYSYVEIGEITGWSYTKINRCMAEGRKRFLQAFADIEEGRRCKELAAALSEMADGEGPNGSTEALRFHLRSCAACRAKLRAYRAIPGKVFDLLPAGPLLDHSMGGRAHEWLAERAGPIVDRIRETGYSLLSRSGGGGSGDAASVAAAGGTRGAGMAAVAKVLALCGATAAGGATCVATGVVDAGGGGAQSDSARVPVVRQAEPTTSTTAPVVRPQAPAPGQDAPEPAPEPEPPSQPTPVQQKTRQFGVESQPSSSASPGGGGEFGGSSGGGGVSGGGGGGGGSGGGFGIE
jgi:RNA polymerase sigma factor (sigma-70 family)